MWCYWSESDVALGPTDSEPYLYSCMSAGWLERGREGERGRERGQRGRKGRRERQRERQRDSESKEGVCNILYVCVNMLCQEVPKHTTL